MHGTLVGTEREAALPARLSAAPTPAWSPTRSGTRRIYWNPFHRATVRLAPGARPRARAARRRLDTVRGGSRLTVDYRPVMADH